jgi:hypothetical protein
MRVVLCCGVLLAFLVTATGLAQEESDKSTEKQPVADMAIEETLGARPPESLQNTAEIRPWLAVIGSHAKRIGGRG